MTAETISTWGILFGTVATAIATIFLWRVTRLLAVETRRMADASAQPQVVATLVPNQWSTIHFDIQIENTGNATAFNIEAVFDPPLTNGEIRSEDNVVPFKKVSVLKPGQRLASYLRDASGVLDNVYSVEVSWSLKPANQIRQTLSYTLDMKDYAGVSYLGARDPIVQIATEMKNLREDWRSIATGSRKLSADTYNSDDRQREREALEERYAARRRGGSGEADSSS